MFQFMLETLIMTRTLAQEQGFACLADEIDTAILVAQVELETSAKESVYLSMCRASNSMH